MEHPTITLGEHEIPVYPQRHAYLTRRVGKFLDVLSEGAEGIKGIEGLIRLAGNGVYELLVALIPNLAKRLPEYEFHGFGSREAWENDDYREEEDRSPTFPELVDAFEMAVRINRFDAMGVIKNFVDPSGLFPIKLGSEPSKDSPSLPGTSGESDPTSSGERIPMSDSSELPETTAPAVNGSTQTTSESLSPS